MLITMAGSLIYSPEFPIPGVESYALRVNFDRSVFKEGRYFYGDKNATAVTKQFNKLPARELGLDRFFDLQVEMWSLNGEKLRSDIDMNCLIDELVATTKLPDLRSSEHGGGATLVIEIEQHQVEVQYHLHKDYLGEQGQFYFETQVFPVATIPLITSP